MSMDPEIADRVRALIAGSGQSNKEFAAGIGLDDDKLSKALNGRRRFSSYELASVASVGGTTVDWLLTGVQPVELGRAARTTSAAVDLEDAGRDLAAKYERASAALLRLGRREAARELPEFPSTSSFTRDGWGAAEWAVELLGSEYVTAPTIDLQEALESTFSIDIAGSSELPKDCDGLAFQHDAFRLVILASTPVWTRRRFTLAHEVGHLLFNDATQLRHESMSPGRRGNDFAEKRANAFAAAFLMPEQLVRDKVKAALSDETFHALVVAFMVSPSAMAVRLRQLELIDQAEFDHFQSFKSRDSWIAAEGDDSAEVTTASADLPPFGMLRQFLDAYRDGEVSAKPLVELTDLDESIWRKLVHGVPTLAAVPPFEPETELEPSFAP